MNGEFIFILCSKIVLNDTLASLIEKFNVIGWKEPLFTAQFAFEPSGNVFFAFDHSDDIVGFER
jgi:hypothetical protein